MRLGGSDRLRLEIFVVGVEATAIMSGPSFISSIFSSMRADATPYCMIGSTLFMIASCSRFQSA